MVLEGYTGPERVLLSYDVRGSARSAAARVCQIVFGRVRASEAPGKPRYVEEGFIHRPGVVWVGQSVLVLPPHDALELEVALRRLGVRVASGPVTVSQVVLERFRRSRGTARRVAPA